MARQKWAIKLVFAAVLLWQIPQYVITAKFGEPYPALSMPSFTGTLTDASGNIRFASVKCEVFFESGRLAWVSPHALLSQVPDSSRYPIMAHMFSPPPAAANQVQTQTLKALLFPGRTLSRIRGQQKEVDPQTKAWLMRRLQVLYPSEIPKAATFVWYQHVFNVNHVPPAATQERSGIREMRFE